MTLYPTYDPATFEGSRPNNVGIKAMDFYVPRYFVAQADLERHDGVSEGKLLTSISVPALLILGFCFQESILSA